MSIDSPDQCRQELSELLQAQLAKIGEVNAYLVELKSLLAQNDIEAINDSVSKSSLPIADIEVLEKNRNQLLIHYGFQGDKSGHEACIDWCDNNEGQLTKQYQSFTESLLQLQRSIQVNDLLANKGQDRVRRSVGILTGEDTSDKSNTYSKSGQARKGINKRSITLA